MRNAKRHFKKFGKPALAALLVGLILLLNAMAACPALHELIHKDADEADHHCAVTMFAHGQVESTTCDIPVVTPTILIEATSQIEFSIFSPTIENLPPGRAPPLSVSSTV